MHAAVKPDRDETVSSDLCTGRRISIAQPARVSSFESFTFLDANVISKRFSGCGIASFPQASKKKKKGMKAFDNNSHRGTRASPGDGIQDELSSRYAKYSVLNTRKGSSITRSCPWQAHATKVRHRSTCRNSFRDIFLRQPFARHLNQVYGF